MGTALAEAAPAAIGLALVNPLPVMAIVVLLASPRSGAAVALLAGWLVGLIAVLGFLLFVVPLDRSMGSEAAPSMLASAIRLLLGLLLLVLAAQKWRSRPKQGETNDPPGWMASLAKATPIQAAGLGALLSGLNPKNLAFTVSASIALAELGLTAGERLVSIVVFVVLASIGVAAPVFWRAVARERASAQLAGWLDWLTENYNTMMAVVFLLIGVKLAAQGLGALIG